MAKLLISDKNGRIFDHPDLEATGMKAGNLSRLNPGDLIKLPPESELFTLPHRLPVGFNPDSKKF